MKPLNALKLSALALALTLANGSASAQASNIWDNMPRVAYATPVGAGTGVVDMALGQLVPRPYLVEINNNVPPTLTMRWDANADWKKALDKAALEAGLVITPDWTRNTLVVARSPLAIANDVAAAKMLPTTGAALAAPAASAAPVVTSPATVSNWVVSLQDVTLAKSLERWAKDAGWRVRWDAAKNVMVDAPNTYSGTFEAAVTAALSSPGITNSEYPLEVCFYPNTPPLARITRRGEAACK